MDSRSEIDSMRSLSFLSFALFSLFLFQTSVFGIFRWPSLATRFCLVLLLLFSKSGIASIKSESRACCPSNAQIRSNSDLFDIFPSFLVLFTPNASSLLHSSSISHGFVIRKAFRISPARTTPFKSPRIMATALSRGSTCSWSVRAIPITAESIFLARRVKPVSVRVEISHAATAECIWAPAKIIISSPVTCTSTGSGSGPVPIPGSGSGSKYGSRSGSMTPSFSRQLWSSES
mmetsp:Transcript_18577/g.33759  ORF Transcript_18577/g.33759 Transcript_18577/m.33759 type:complete len:233 (+) Transcript_18577:3223-3921(+)